MRTLLALAAGLLAVGTGASPAAERSDAIRTELKSLEGTWQLRSMTLSGKEVREDFKEIEFVAKDGALAAASAKEGQPQFILKLDPSASPKTVDVLFVSTPAATLHGIYKREGEFLTICHAGEGKDRPTEFASKPGLGTSLMVYQRRQEAAPKGPAPGTKTTTEAKAAPQPKPSAGPRWEYKVLNSAEVQELGEKDLSAGLNKLGEEGWELVAVEGGFGPPERGGFGRGGGGPPPTRGRATYYFKRPKAAVARGEPAAPAARADWVAEDFKVFMLKNAEAASLAKTLQALFQERTVRLVADPNTNALLIRAPAEQHEVIQHLIQVLDQAAADARPEPKKR